jgi:thiamine pyrophosphate-dependent acetolactate synthase large subunit-like protein
MATPKITGAEYLARALDAYGVTAAFFVPTILSKTRYALEAALAGGRPAVIDVVTEMEALAPAGVTQPAPPVA